MRHNRYAGLFRCFHHGGDFFNVAGQHNDLRHDLKDRAVLFVNDNVFFFNQDVALADDTAQIANESFSIHCWGA